MEDKLPIVKKDKPGTRGWGKNFSRAWDAFWK